MLRRSRILVLPALLAFACSSGGGGDEPDVYDAAPDVAVDVPSAPDIAPDVAPDIAPDVFLGCPDGTVIVPALAECYPLAGDPETECQPGDQFVLSFGSAITPEPPEAPAPLVEWDALPGTVTDVLQDQVEVTGRRTTDDGSEEVVARFQWSNWASFGVPWTKGLAVQLEWIGVDDPYSEVSTRHGLKVMDAVGRLLFLVDDGKGDLADPIWTLAPEGGGMEGWRVTRVSAGCPVLAEPRGRDTAALPVALDVSLEGDDTAQAVVLPGVQAVFEVDGVNVIVTNALAELRVGDDADQPERMAWVLNSLRDFPPGTAGAACRDTDPACDDGLSCVNWPGGARVCRP